MSKPKSGGVGGRGSYNARNLDISVQDPLEQVPQSRQSKTCSVGAHLNLSLDPPLSCTYGAACPVEGDSLQLQSKQPYRGSSPIICTWNCLQEPNLSCCQHRRRNSVLHWLHCCLATLLSALCCCSQASWDCLSPAHNTARVRQPLQPIGQVPACAWLLQPGLLEGAPPGFTHPSCPCQATLLRSQMP